MAYTDKTLEARIFDICYDGPIRVSDLTLSFHNSCSAKKVREAVECMVQKGELLEGFEPSLNRNRKVPTVSVAMLKRRRAT